MSSEHTQKLNLNTATEEELQLIPGVGRITARRIITSRLSGHFKHISDLKRVRGFSQASYDQIIEFVFVEVEPANVNPALLAILFRSKSARGTSKAIPPIDFYGTPHKLTGVVPFVNTLDQSSRLNAIGLEKTELRAPDGAIMKEIPIRRWLQPREHVNIPVSLALDPRTAPGIHKAELVLGNQRQPVIFHVAEVVELKVVPEALVIDNQPGSHVLKTIFVTNRGNKTIEFGDIGVVGLERADLICNTIRETVSQVEDPDLDRTVATFVKTLNKSFQESKALTVRTQGKPIKSSPGETVSVDLSITLPQSLRRRRRYFGSVQLYNASISILVQSTSGGDSEQSD